MNYARLSIIASVGALLCTSATAQTSGADHSQWNGPYIGGSVGAAWDRDGALNWAEANAQTVSFGWPTCYGSGSCPHTVNGATNTTLAVGFHAGYNLVFNGMLVGLEGGINGRPGSMNSSLSPTGPWSPSYVLQKYSESANWIGTVRGRFGAFAKPDLLVYGTGGLAFGEIKRFYSANASNSFGSQGTSSTNGTGWTAGGGLEWAFLRNVSLGLEYLHTDIGSGGQFSSSGNFGICLSGGCSFNANNGHFIDDSVSLIINFKL